MTIGTSYKIGRATVTRFTETTLKGLKPSSLYPEWKDEALDDYQSLSSAGLTRAKTGKTFI